MPDITNQYAMIFELAVERAAKRRAIDLIKEKIARKAAKLIAQDKKDIIKQLIASGMKKKELACILHMPLEKLEALIT